MTSIKTFVDIFHNFEYAIICGEIELNYFYVKGITFLIFNNIWLFLEIGVIVV